jgi:adenylate cyclase
MIDYVKKWGWSGQLIGKMDNFENWDIDSVNHLWNDTKKYILKGYKSILGNMESLRIGHKINDEDLKSISRKIFSHFSVTDTKIDNSLSFKNYPSEKLLTIEFIRDKDGKEYWILSKRVIIHNLPNKIIIHKENRLIGLVVWISLNRLFQKDFTRMDIDTGLHAVDANFIRDLIAELSFNFSFKLIELHNSYFLKEAMPIISYIIINPHTKYSQKIEQIIFLYHNSWGETRFETYEGQIDIPKIMMKVLSGGLLSGMDVGRALHITSSQPYKSYKEFDRINLLLKDMYSFFTDGNNGVRKRYITIFGNIFFVFSIKRTGSDETIVCTPYETELKMLYSLSYNTGERNRIRIDPTISELNHLKKIIENQRDDSIQIYYQKGNKYCYYFVSDEAGSIIFFRKSADTFYEYLARLYMFASNAVKNAVASNPESKLSGILKSIRIFQMDTDAKHSCRITEINPELDSTINEIQRKCMPFRVSLHRAGNGEIGYRISLPDGNYTDTLTKSQVSGIAGKLKTIMGSVKGYSYFVTDINLSNVNVDQYKKYTSYSFTEKNVFELLIESTFNK